MNTATILNPAPDFNRLVRLYRWMEYASFGPWLWWCRCAFLDDLRNRRHALVLGDGDGRFTARLLRLNPGLHIDAVDASPAMLRALARRASPYADRLRTHCADLRLWPSETDEPYDLIVTHFFLDCLDPDEICSLAARLRAAASPTALWVVSEFAVPSAGVERMLARPIVSGLYRAFGWMTGLVVRELPDHGAALREAGFSLQKNRVWLGGLLASQIWSPVCCAADDACAS